MSLHLFTHLEDIFIPCSISLSRSELCSNTFNLSHICTCVWSRAYMCICKCVCEHVFVCVCDTQPSITSLESFRSRCAPIHTHSLCFDFSKSKDVNHLPPRVRAGEFIHTGTHARLHTAACTHTHMHKRSINVLLPLPSISVLLSLVTPPQPFHYLRVISCASVVHNTLLMDN